MPPQKPSMSAQCCSCAFSTISRPACVPSHCKNACMMLSISLCVSGRSSLTMPASRKTMRRLPLRPATRMLPGCRSQCTKLSMKIILAIEFMPRRESSLRARASHADESMKVEMGTPGWKLSTSRSRDERRGNGSGITIASSFAKFACSRARFLASCLRSSCQNICSAKSSTTSGSESHLSAGMRDSTCATVLMMSMSTSTIASTPGWITLTATSTRRPLFASATARPR
mmetsp:Transcript_17140/g.53286  ORF Transcript_17140/g.53286 Transcript_17140/m.53286 type:complete len:229 (+) Transcript_17140:526-1212(+)